VKVGHHIFTSIANGLFGMFTGRKTHPTFFDIGAAHPAPHRVNSGTELRAVLIVNLRRPLPRFADLVNRLPVDVIGHYTFGRSLARKAEKFALARLDRQRIAA
jgi:hypothetical protein